MKPTDETAPIQIATVAQDHEPALRACLSDVELLAGLFPFLARRDHYADLFEGDESGPIWAILVGGVVAGAVGLSGNYMLVFVAPAHQRRGIAAKALSLAIAQLHAMGRSDFHAEIARSNLASRKLFEAAGFTYRGMRNSMRATEPLLQYSLTLAG